MQKFFKKFQQTEPNNIYTGHQDQVGFLLGIQGWFNFWKLINVIHRINRPKNEKPCNHLNRYVKRIWPNQASISDFFKKKIQQTGNKREFPQSDKKHLPKTCANIAFNGERLNFFMLRSGANHTSPLSPLLFTLSWKS